MIKFFRHIRLRLITKASSDKVRQRMIKENRCFRYFLYAIGEITLVVIGILIALQVSDWNEQRKYLKQEVKILNQLNADLKANEIEIDGLNDIQKTRMWMCDSILVYLNDKRPFDDSLKRYFEKINTDGLFNCSNTTYKYIQSQGVNFLSNDTLRGKVTRMYERDFQNVFTREEMTWRIIHESLRPAYDRLFKSTLAVYQAEDYYLVNTPKDMGILYKDEAFKNAVVRLRAAVVVRVRYISETLIDLNQLIEEINVETKRLSE